MATGQTGRVLVVIPAFNEAGSVGTVVADVRDVLPLATILVVDDGSIDGTAAAARAAGAIVARLPFNLGVGGAMRTGYRFAERNGYEVAVQVDGDGQHDASYLPQLIDAVSQADVVIGARFAGEGDYAVRGPRVWAMRVLSRVVGRIVRAPLTDVTSGYRACSRRAIKVFSHHYPAEYLGDTVESLVIAHRAGLRVAQVPVAMRRRTTGLPSQSLLGSVTYLARACAALGFALIRRWPVPEEAT